MSSTSEPGHAPEPVDFLIVTALPEERDAILRLLEDYQQVQIDSSLVCYQSSLRAANQEFPYSLAITQFSQMGNVEAGIHTARAIEALGPSYVLMVGIAAGVKQNQAALGDVVIPTQVLYYEHAKHTTGGPEQRPFSLPADHCLLHNAQNHRVVDWSTLDTEQSLSLDRSESGSTRYPHVHFGPFAVGEKVIANQEFVNELLRLHPKLVGIEMESYGVSMAAHSALSRPGFLAIRGVSDLADEAKSDEWRERAAVNAAAFAISFLRSGPVLPRASRGSSKTIALKPRGSLIVIRHLSMQYVSLQTVLDSLPPEFADLDVVELFLDQTDLYRNGRLLDPIEAARRQADLDQRLRSLRQASSNVSIAYCGIAHIPLLFHLGYRLSNKCPLHFFELDRRGSHWSALQKEVDGPALKLDGIPPRGDGQAGDVLARISISDVVRLEDVERIVPSPLASLHLYIEPTRRDAVRSERQLSSYGVAFRSMLDDIHRLFPGRNRLHLFYAGPVSLAVYFGQLISPTIDRSVVVYNYTGKDCPPYSWGLEITAETDSNGFWVEVPKTSEGVC